MLGDLSQEGILLNLDLILSFNLGFSIFKTRTIKQSHLSDKDGVGDGCKVLTELPSAT